MNILFWLMISRESIMEWNAQQQEATQWHKHVSDTHHLLKTQQSMQWRSNQKYSTLYNPKTSVSDSLPPSRLTLLKVPASLNSTPCWKPSRNTEGPMQEYFTFQPQQETFLKGAVNDSFVLIFMWFPLTDMCLCGS